jgi:2-furoyl-CoA dehydrogenase 2Fe-2S iron sulfur subunit
MKRYGAGVNHRIAFTLNGGPRSADAEERILLSVFLRHRLGATGTHVGCVHGVCGACTVRIDGRAVRSCLTLAVQAEGRQVDTVEGLAQREGLAHGESLSDLQAAFRRHHALQCGFCTAGILMSATAFLERVQEPSEREVREMLSGHLCRCTGYGPIVQAILDVAAQRRRAMHKETRHV